MGHMRAPASWAGVCPLHQHLCGWGPKCLCDYSLNYRVRPLAWHWSVHLLYAGRLLQSVNTFLSSHRAGPETSDLMYPGERHSWILFAISVTLPHFVSKLASLALAARFHTLAAADAAADEEAASQWA